MRKKVFAFDLDTAKLKQLYPTHNWQNAYRDIGSFLHKNGFDHLQGSVYISSKPMNETKAISVITDLCFKYDWFCESVSDWKMANDIPYQDVTDTIKQIGETFKAEKLQSDELFDFLANTIVNKK